MNTKSPTNTKEVQKLTRRIIVLNPSIPWSLKHLKKFFTNSPLLSKPTNDETLYIYLAVAKGAMSVALVQEEEYK